MAPKPSGKKRARQAAFLASFTSPRSRPNPHTLTHIHFDANGLTTEECAIPVPAYSIPATFQLLEPLNLEPDPIDNHSDGEEDDNVEAEVVGHEVGITQTRAVLQAFMNIEDELQDSILGGYEHKEEGKLCSCGRSVCLVKCYDCLQYGSSCLRCFADLHFHHPFHWARLWDPEKRFFRKVDFSFILRQAGIDGAIQLGHTGDRKPCPANATSIPFIITHTNGIHSTWLRICRCPDAPDKVAQLMQARLFPATPTDPKSAFTFATLREFHMHGLQSKSSAFDYILSLRRLTDNVLTHEVPDTYKAFMHVSRIWDYLTLKRWVGQDHGIDQSLPHRPSGNIVTYCPACIELGVNMTPEEVQSCPNELRHLITNFKTADGNHHANRYAKNTDRSDTSLWDRYSTYFPSKSIYEVYLNSLPETKEKSTCNFITAVNAQNKKKFRGNDETGTINVQCPHVFVEACVNMFAGERFGYGDFALARSLDLRLLDGLRHVLAYDTNCSYSVNIATRFQTFFPRHVTTISDMLYTIDSLHVHNHLDRCIYKYGTYYQECTGHFHAVGTEQFWSENNQLGSQVRQMGPGHRQDKITQGDADWNHKKSIKLARQIIRELRIAWMNYVEKRDFFKQLTEVFSEEAKTWVHLDQQPKLVNGVLHSVFCHLSSNAPSLDSILKRLLATSPSTSNLSASLATSGDSAAVFLAEGIDIKVKQVHLGQLIERNVSHPLIATQQEIKVTREDLQQHLRGWREHQLTTHMESVKAIIADRHPQPLEKEELFLPSEFSEAERQEFGLTELASLEAQLWEGHALECIMRLRCVGKTISSFRDLREKEPGSQRSGTRNTTRFQQLEFLQTRILTNYEDARGALDSLNMLSPVADRFPPLSHADLFRKSTQHKRQIGDTYRSDGALYGLHGIKKGATTTKSISDPPGPHSGKLWNVTTGLSEEDFRIWQEEEDRVQWFRAWAEMMRWIEEFEMKHAELTRVIRCFDRMSRVWEELAKKSVRSGYAEFGRRQASIYQNLCTDATTLYRTHGEPRFVHPETTLTEAISIFRKQELSWFADLTLSTSPSSLSQGGHQLNIQK